MKYAVIGLGAFGSSAARQLFRKGAEVIGVDVNMDRVNSVKDEVSLVVRLDATHENALRSHGIGDVDVLIAAIGDNFEAQVLVVVHAKQHGIKKIIARATTPDHIRILKAVGADEVFNPEETAARSDGTEAAYHKARQLPRSLVLYRASLFCVKHIGPPPTEVGALMFLETNNVMF